MVSDNLDNYIRSKGYKVKVVAANSGLSYAALLGILCGTRKLTLEEYIRICRTLGVSFTTFIEE